MSDCLLCHQPNADSLCDTCETKTLKQLGASPSARITAMKWVDGRWWFEWKEPASVRTMTGSLRHG